MSDMVPHYYYSENQRLRASKLLHRTVRTKLFAGLHSRESVKRTKAVPLQSIRMFPLVPWCLISQRCTRGKPFIGLKKMFTHTII